MSNSFPQQAGIYERMWGEQRYTLSLPDGYAAGEKRPFVLALHYGGQVTPFYGRGLLEALVEPGLRELGAIIVAPDCPGQGWTNEVSETAVLNLLDHLAPHYPIDPATSLITGYSMGGKGTWYFAARHQNRFAAALPMAGVPQPDSAQVDWHIPIYALHGENDELFAVEPTRHLIEQLVGRGLSAHLTVLPNVSHYQTDLFVDGLKTAVSWLQSVTSLH